MKANRRQAIAVMTSAVPASGTTFKAAHAAAQTSSELSSDAARAIGKEIFLWGMHPVAIYHLRYLHTQNEKSPVYVGGSISAGSCADQCSAARATSSRLRCLTCGTSRNITTVARP